MMKKLKKLVVGLVAFGVTFGALAQVSQTSESVDPFTPPAVFREVVIDAINKMVADVAALATESNATADNGRVQTVTETNIVSTAINPTSGNIAYAPNGTNATWLINTGSTTNDWVILVVPE